MTDLAALRGGLETEYCPISTSGDKQCRQRRNHVAALPRLLPPPLGLPRTACRRYSATDSPCAPTRTGSPGACGMRRGCFHLGFVLLAAGTLAVLAVAQPEEIHKNSFSGK